MPRPIALALACAALAALAVPAPAAAESPTDGACDGSGLLVCAGADLGARVECATDAAGAASCSWTYGWLTTAYSPAGLPGSEEHEVEVVVETCVAGACSSETAAFPASCAWLPALSCDEDVGPLEGSTDAQLALGQCLTVRVTLTAAIEASVPTGLPTMASVTFQNDGGDAGAACLNDNGRG